MKDMGEGVDVVEGGMTVAGKGVVNACIVCILSVAASCLRNELSDIWRGEDGYSRPQ